MVELDEDWIRKMSWDLPTELEPLLAVLADPSKPLDEANKVATAKRVLESPSWPNAPESLKVEMKLFLARSG